ncbi:PH domain-containing protein [Antribacter gilvus]|uniref:PH domain-containing protein n=1 Tax=Antribacter gilvus TaxID=2304675 RepID=UPI000F76F478|nr:PH domain-containing protein [Antribacter gilvus]
MSDASDILFQNRSLFRYVGPKEKVVFATHRHWACLWKPLLIAAGTFVFVLSATMSVPELSWLWLGFVAAAGNLLWRWLEWRAEWFVVTNLQIRLISGIVGTTVRTMPTKSVTDFRFSRPPHGMLLGFGSFRFESAGQDQELSLIDYIPEPDARYHQLTSTFFPEPKKEEPKPGPSIVVVPGGHPMTSPGPPPPTQQIPVVSPADGAGGHGGPPVPPPGLPAHRYEPGARRPEPFIEGGRDPKLG